MIILMGDFNARVGKQEHLTVPQTVGAHAVDVKIENGIRFIEFCLKNDTLILNIFFQHKLVHQTSWKHSGNKQWHMLIYTIVNKKFKSSIEDVRVYRRAARSTGTDRHLMRSKIKLHLKSRRKKTQESQLHLDRLKLQDDNIVKHCRNDIEQIFEDGKNDDVNINEKYSSFVQCIKEAAQTHFKLANNTKKKRKEWLTDDILKVVEKKSSAYFIWQNYRGTSEEKKYKNKCISYRKLVKLMINKRQNEYWDELKKDIEIAIINHDPATAYTMIRRLKGEKQNVENSSIQDKNGKLFSNSRDKLNRWKEYFSELLNINSVVDPHLIHHIVTLSNINNRTR